MASAAVRGRDPLCGEGERIRHMSHDGRRVVPATIATATDAGAECDMSSDMMATHVNAASELVAYMARPRGKNAAGRPRVMSAGGAMGAADAAERKALTARHSR